MADITHPHDYVGPTDGTCTLTWVHGGRLLATCAEPPDAGIHQSWPEDRTPHKYLPASASDPRCMQVHPTGPWSHEPCGEGPDAAVHSDCTKAGGR